MHGQHPRLLVGWLRHQRQQRLRGEAERIDEELTAQMRHMQRILINYQ